MRKKKMLKYLLWKIISTQGEKSRIRIIFKYLDLTIWVSLNNGRD